MEAGLRRESQLAIADVVENCGRPFHIAVIMHFNTDSIFRFNPMIGRESMVAATCMVALGTFQLLACMPAGTWAVVNV